jgi:glycosyltransferase involved in cell wall biosynthesis
MPQNAAGRERSSGGGQKLPLIPAVTDAGGSMAIEDPTPRKLRILLVVNGRIGDRMAAPEIRGWEMARALSIEHDVTVAARGAAREHRDGVWLVGSERRSLVREARRSDVVIAPRVPPYLFAALAGSRTQIVADLYNPFDLEHAELTGRGAIRRELEAARVSHGLQLRFSDVVLCAVEPQRRRLARELAQTSRRRSADPRIVPFGIGDDPPAPARRPIRACFPEIGPDDTVVLWWGNVWRWFDAETAIDAFARLVRNRPRLRLVFTAGRSPRGSWPELERTDEARARAQELGLLGRNVFFIEEWVTQSERHEYLQEADVGLTLARETPEKEQAARGRYMDYLWASLPCLLGAGDELADRFAEAGFALTAESGDVDGATEALARLVDDPELRAQAKAARQPLAELYRWPAAVRPLTDTLAELAGARPEHESAHTALAGQLRAYYARKLVHRAALALAREH